MEAGPMHKDESDVVRPWWSTTVLVVEDSSIIADGDCRHSVAVTLTVQIDRTLEVVSIDVWTECRLQSSVRIVVTGAETLPIGTTKVDTSQVYIILLMIMLLDRSVDERHAPVSTQIDANSDGGSRLVHSTMICTLFESIQICHVRAASVDNVLG